MIKQFYKGTVILGSTAGFTAVLNLFFYKVSSKLTIEDFGILTSLIAISYFIIVIQNVVTNLFTKIAASNDLALAEFVKVSSRYVIRLQFLITIIFLTFSMFFLKQFLKLDSFYPLLAISTLFLSALLVSMCRGILRAKLHFFASSLTQIIEVVLKVGLAILAISLDLGLIGILIGISLASLITYFVANYLVASIKGKQPKGQKQSTNFQNIFKGKLIRSISISFLALNLIFVLDSVLARNLLSPVEAGYYGALITFGKLVFFVTGAISASMFSVTANKASQKILSNALILTLFLGVNLVIAVSLFGEIAIKVIFGQDYLFINQFLSLEIIIVTFYSLSYQISLYLISKENQSVSIIAPIFLLIQLGVLMLGGNSISNLLMLQLVLFILLFLVTVGIYLFNNRQHAKI